MAHGKMLVNNVCVNVFPLPCLRILHCLFRALVELQLAKVVKISAYEQAVVSDFLAQREHLSQAQKPQIHGVAVVCQAAGIAAVESSRCRCIKESNSIHPGKHIFHALAGFIHHFVGL